MQRYTQTSKKYEACFSIFYSKCKVSSRFISKIHTNEQEIRSLLQYFLQRVQESNFLFKFCINSIAEKGFFIIFASWKIWLDTYHILLRATTA